MINQLTYTAPTDAERLRIFFRYEQANARTGYLPHQHRWGQVVFVTCNVLEMQVEGERLLTPPGCPSGSRLATSMPVTIISRRIFVR